MSETNRLRNLRDPYVLMAFGGWSDAAQAATDALDHFVTTYEADEVFAIDPADYYDFQESRPMVSLDDEGERYLTWPSTELLVASMPRRDLVIVRGPEPNFRWPQFASAVTSAIRTVQPSLAIILGAMLTENPHTRPVPVIALSQSAPIRERFDAEISQYEGPTGITGVLSVALHGAGIPVLSLWAACPHYVANPPNPKATLALVQRLAGVLEEPVILGDLPARAEVWERSVNELAEDDPDISEYISNLEEADDARQPEVDGDAIAAEFQRYLRRQDEE
jgi:hypothetical protein